MGAATDSWPTQETDPQRRAILAAADRLLAGAPCRSTGNLSVVQLVVEADVKYWVVANGTSTCAITSSTSRVRRGARQPLTANRSTLTTS